MSTIALTGAGMPLHSPSRTDDRSEACPRRRAGSDRSATAEPDDPPSSAIQKPPESTCHVGTPEANVNRSAQTLGIAVDTTDLDGELSTSRLNLMRIGYAFVGVGLAIVRWPLLIPEAPALPLMEGVVTCLLTAMSLLAFRRRYAGTPETHGVDGPVAR